MKTITASLLLAFLATALPAAAQAPGQPGQASLRQPRQAVQPPIPAPHPNSNPGGEAVEFPGNVVLRLEGALYGAVPTDFSVVAGGPSVSMSLPGKTDSPMQAIGNFEASLTPGTPWVVRLSIGARVPLPTATGNVEYRDFSFSTTVRLTPGKKVVLWQQGDQKLMLSLDELKEE